VFNNIIENPAISVIGELVLLNRGARGGIENENHIGYFVIL